MDAKLMFRAGPVSVLGPDGVNNLLRIPILPIQITNPPKSA